MSKYPVYIISKGRYERPLTANRFKEDGIDFKIAVEPQEYDQYCESIGEEYVLKLPFSNLGKGSFPARNFCWEDSIKNGYDRHWMFDDNIYRFRRLHKGKRIPVNGRIAIDMVEEFTDRYKNIGISGFNYDKFVLGDTKKPFIVNVHVYSALLIKNKIPYRWRLLYNEDVDLCLQVLANGLCTVLFNAMTVNKVSTSHKMKGGNQDELYKGNAFDKKVKKARQLEEVWPEYAKVTYRFDRPHHFVDWKKHFKHPLIRRTDIDWEAIKNKSYKIKLRKVKEIKSETLRDFYEENK